ncbi:DNA-processing protein DprA [Pseudofulvibacter geojedonensis]|uniref:DNA-processing protein DprA n=1 Tax=Pseudofulvibacter geojedonensis TaxID=1123758 RepID=A0ABW3HZZ7_9FLAO
MTEENLISILALQKASLIGDLTAKKLINHCGSAEAIFKEKSTHLLKINGIGQAHINSLKNKTIFNLAEDELKFIKKNNLKYWYYKNIDYPNKLKHCIDAPILLFYSGNINLNSPKIISVVGTRNLTNNGKYFCEKLIEELSLVNPIIISGFAYGTDICAQKSAIKNNLQTIGCLAHGLNQIYPKVHKKYVKQVEANGGFVTDFWSIDEPERNNFLKRNRIIAGLSEATIVIESAKKGGSLVTADIANSYNREVFAVPGRANDELSEGCNNLIKHQKAQLITCAADIIYHLNWSVETTAKKVIQPQLFVELSDIENTVFSFLSQQEKTHLDAISIACKLPIYQLSSTLLNLELKGLIRALPGKQFQSI